jgi:mannose-6-phosphate isomerase-like protein (cupin superfamily)
MTFKASGEDTGGAYSLTDSMVPPQRDPPPHIHHREDEAFRVLEGELEVLVGENKFKAGAGSFVHPPKGVLHSYQNVGTGPARLLTLMVPAGLERFVEEVGKPGTELSSRGRSKKGTSINSWRSHRSTAWRYHHLLSYRPILLVPMYGPDFETHF